jgi:hypothetical protein
MAEQDDDDVTQSQKPTPRQPTQNRLKVTKEELDKSGLSLRDYMNKQLGLKRRDGSAPAPAPAPTASQGKSTPNFDPARMSSEPLVESMRQTQYDQRKENESGATAKVNAALAAQNKAQQASEENKSWWTTPNKNLQEGTFPSGKEIRAALGSKYAKGGSVSSASNRGDGIAQRGKTRGKFC